MTSYETRFIRVDRHHLNRLHISDLRKVVDSTLDHAIHPQPRDILSFGYGMTNITDPKYASHDASGRSTATTSDSNKRHKTSSLTDRSDGVETPNDSKRIMLSIHDKERPQNQAPMEESISSLASPPPKYGSISYWDERYQKQFSLLSQTTMSSNAPTPDGNRKDDDGNINISNGNDVSTLPYHSWYFTYDELRPILLPLLLGERLCPDVLLQSPNTQSEIDEPNTIDGSDDILQEHGEQGEITNGMQPNDENLDEGDTNEHGDVEECDDDDGEWEEVAEDDDEDEKSDLDNEDDDVPVREGLAKDGPVTILEIGCGDVPLGAGLALEFRNLTTTPPLQSTPSTTDHIDDNVDINLSIVTKIICTDYSPVVVDTMNRQYRTTDLDDDQNAVGPSDASSLLNKQSYAPIQFEVVDARQLPYDDSTFHMVLEKGTLDAVLSDTVKGITDCVQIVSECARVTRGCIVIVSHLNAHTPNGLGWLEEVVMEGLKKYSVRPTSDAVSWEIEVHGNAEVVVDDDDEDNETKNGAVPTGTNGPAVYVIHKLMNRVEPQLSSTETIGSPPQQRQPEVDATKAAAASIVSIVTENGTIKSLEDDVVDIVPINVRFFSY